MRYRLLGSSALRVSEVALGTMTFGERWGWGADLAESRRMLDLYLDRGGNFVDTANNYTDGESEEQLGELLAGRRDRAVLATKYTLTSRPDDPNAGGNHRKNLVQTLEASLRRLRTDRIDLLWMHMWDGITPIDEVVRALDDVVAAGKVIAVGISDTPAWVVSRAVAIAELRGWTRPSAIQLPYSLSGRDPERELFPMAASLGLAVLAWGNLDGGVLTGKYEDGGSGPRRYGEHTPSERRLKVAELVREVAGSAKATPSQVCIAWVLAQRGRANLIPILGARTADQVDENLGALAVELAPEALAQLEEATAIPLGFPITFLADDDVVQLIFGDTRELIETSHRAVKGADGWRMLSCMKHKLIRNNDVHIHKGFNKSLAVLITNGVGNMWFFYFLFAFMSSWMLLSRLGVLAFDPYPFALMLLIVGGIFQALAMVAIMVGQNVQSAAGDARAETDHETLEAIHTLSTQAIRILEGQNRILALLEAHGNKA